MPPTMLAARIHRHGGPEVLTLEQVLVPPTGPNDVRIRHSAIGLNFAEVYQRRGEAGPHHETLFPTILGGQGAGVVAEVGANVTGFAVGDPVGYIYAGAYAAESVVPAARVVPLPAGISADIAAAWLLRGMTAEYLLHRLYRVEPGETVLVHAAAGGMGQILSQWANALGARVIGTVGSPAKIPLARASGCDAVIDYAAEDFAARVRDLTGGAGVSVVYDAVGRDVFLPSLDCLRPRGWLVSYGAASGPVGAFDLQLLHRKSLIVTRPTLGSFVATTEDLRASAATFFAAVASGAVKPEIAHRYALADVRQAHEDLESRRTTGASILIP